MSDKLEWKPEEYGTSSSLILNNFIRANVRYGVFSKGKVLKDPYIVSINGKDFECRCESMVEAKKYAVTLLKAILESASKKINNIEEIK